MKKRAGQTIRLALAGIFMFSILVSCVTLEKMGVKKGEEETAPAVASKTKGLSSAPTTQGAEKFFVHSVVWPNESLSIIAKWYTGSLMNWKALAKANPEMNPTVIHVGDRIRIPVNMLETRDPMPEKFVDELVQDLKNKSASQGAKEEKEEPALFGPKGL